MIKPTRIILITAALAVTGGVSFAQQADPEPAESGRSAGQQPIGAVEPEQARNYGVFRREETASDRLADPVVRIVEKGMTQEQGVAAGLARRAQVTASNDAVYVLPGRGWLCLYVDDPESQSGSATCSRTADALRGWFLLIEWPSPGITRVTGVVPDGIEEVTMTGHEGGVERVKPVQNTFVFETGLTPKTIEWGDVIKTIPESLGKG